MTISDERRELEDTIMESLGHIQKKLDQASKRISLAQEQMERGEWKDSARIVPEDGTIEQDLIQIASNISMAKNDMDARMKDYKELLKIIDEDRKEADKE